MTYRELYEKAERKLEKGEITSGEFDEMTKPLDEEIRPHGKWIDKGEYAECSICGANSGTQFDGVEPIPLKTNFCPNCGADMRKEGDENG